MITFELEGVEVDHCTECTGIWLDAGELELLLGNPEDAKKLLDSFNIDKTCKEKPRKCPICNKKMQKVLVAMAQSPLLIDRCPKNHGLWFDKGELKEILSVTSFTDENKVAKLLSQIFTD